MFKTLTATKIKLLTSTQPELQTILSFDISPVKKTFLEKHPTLNVDVIEYQLKNFLYLICITKQELRLPSMEVDELLHEFMIHSKLYFEFCDEFNDGEYVHHNPELEIERSVVKKGHYELSRVAIEKIGYDPFTYNYKGRDCMCEVGNCNN